VIRLALEDLRHDALTFGFNVLALGVLIFAFLLLIPLSLAVTRFEEDGGLPQNLIVVERDVLQPEQSRIAPGLADDVSSILGDRLRRLDPVIFRILRIDEHPIQVRGVAIESWTTTFGLQLLEGSWPSDASEVVIGDLAAQVGGWHPGSEINIYGRPHRVAGIADGPGTKTQTVWMSYTSASSLFGTGKAAQVLVAQLRPTVDPLASRQDLENGLRSMGAGYDVYFEDALLREYGAALNDLRSLGLVTAIIAIAAVALGSHNLAWLAAEERRRLLGVLRTVGFDRRAVGRYLLLRAGMISAASYALALGAAIAFIQLRVGGSTLAIGGTETALHLTPLMAALGLLLTCLASLAGTWLSAREVLRTTPASLLGRGPGSTFA
jgi:ABC-type antimicrobial peptide transport system permease subunit